MSDIVALALLDIYSHKLLDDEAASAAGAGFAPGACLGLPAGAGGAGVHQVNRHETFAPVNWATQAIFSEVMTTVALA